MEIRSRCIALRTVSYKDSRAIVTCLVREAGRMSFAVANGKGRESTRRRAVMMPGSVFDAVIDYRESRQLQSMREVMPVMTSMAGAEAMSVAFFICDLADIVMREGQRDELMFDFVEHMLEVTHRGVKIANVPIAYLVGVMQFAGILPDVGEYRSGWVLDIEGGVFRPMPPSHNRWLTPEESAVAARIIRMNPDNMSRFRFVRAERARIMDVMLQYLTMHYAPMGAMRSLEVLRGVFGS